MRTAAIQNQLSTTLHRLTVRFNELRARVRRHLATHPNAIQTTTGAELLDFRSPHPHWIVSRGLCMFRREDFSNVPRNKRRAAVELRVPVWSPFRRPGHHCVWAGGIAMVWFWDRDKIHIGDELFGAPATADAGVRIVPETVFHPTRSDGVHLQACHEGFELQRWRDDVLEDAFWFPTRPVEQDVAWFLARTGDAEAHLPAELLPAPATPLLPDPWSSALSPREWFEVNETALVAAAVLLLAVALVWQETRVWKAHYIKAAAIEEFEHLQDTLAPELTARTELLDLRTQNRAIARILREPSQARLMAIVDAAVPSADARFVAWRYQQGELRVVVEDPTPHPIAYVESFAAVPIFEDVQAAQERTAERLEITMRVAP